MYEELLTESRKSHESNVAAVILAKTRYDLQILPFVQRRPARLSSPMVQMEIARIVAECASETNADPAYVGSALRELIAKPQQMDVEFSEAELKDGTPPPKFDPAKVNPEPGAVTSPLDHGTVLEEQAREPDEQFDLNQESQKSSCVRCGAEAENIVCNPCNDYLVRKAAPPPATTPNPTQQTTAPLVPNQQQAVRCTACGFTGTPQQLDQHLVQYANDPAHLQAAQQAQMKNLVAPTATFDKEAQPSVQPMQPTQQAPAPQPQQAPQAPPQKDDHGQVTVDEGRQDPVDRFSDTVQALADRAAARRYSIPTEEEIQAVAQQYGIDPEVARQRLSVVATFGDFVATNGELGRAADTNDLSEVDVGGLGGRVDAHEALVPVDLAVRKVAEATGLDSQDIYSAIRDAFGADLSDKYHASVSGEHRFFLPSDLVDAS